MIAARLRHFVEKEQDGQQNQRHADHVGVQVAIEKCEIGHFCDSAAPDAGGLGQDARGSPIPAVAADGQALALQGASGAAQQSANQRA